MAYKAGHGLSKEAIEKVRARKAAGLGLPSKDSSDQWQKVLGDGKKVARCGDCSRPLREGEGAHVFLCQACLSKSDVKVKTDVACRSDGCSTPSTVAYSDDRASVGMLSPTEAQIAAAFDKGIEGFEGFEAVCGDEAPSYTVAEALAVNAPKPKDVQSKQFCFNPNATEFRMDAGTGVFNEAGMLQFGVAAEECAYNPGAHWFTYGPMSFGAMMPTIEPSMMIAEKWTQ